MSVSPIDGVLAIEGARVICPASGLDQVRDLFVDGAGTLWFERPSAAPLRRLNAKGLVAAPGFIELHAHLREPGAPDSETIRSGLAAALAGGYTAVFAMANTNPVNDRPEVTRGMLEAARAAGSPVRLLPVSAATRGLLGREVADYAAQKAAGAGAVSDDGKPILDDAVMERCMAAAAAAGLPIFSHATHDPRPGGGVLNDGAAARRLGVPGLPAAEEDRLVARDVELSRRTGHPVHVCHISTAGAVAAIRRAQAEGLSVTAEAAPHHLLLIDDDVRGPDEKVNPPLREEADRAAVTAALADGTIEAVATDHAPHAPARKARGLLDAPFGIIGMESAFPALYTGLVRTGRISLVELLRRFTEGPARIGRTTGGRIAPGDRAEVTLIDPETAFVLTPDRLRSRSRNCPFLGRTLAGGIVATVAGAFLRASKLERIRSAGL